MHPFHAAMSGGFSCPAWRKARSDADGDKLGSLYTPHCKVGELVNELADTCLSGRRMPLVCGVAETCRTVLCRRIDARSFHFGYSDAAKIARVS
jgi:hypothetical protein